MRDGDGLSSSYYITGRRIAPDASSCPPPIMLLQRYLYGQVSPYAPLESQPPSLSNLNLTWFETCRLRVLYFERCSAVTGIGCIEPRRLLVAILHCCMASGLGNKSGGREHVAISATAFLSLCAACSYSHA
jgi:hypothetical protein